ncbi:MAG: 16S rRNA (uracil(1498)-N(3))-methyltransferase [Anaerotignaceae bacterium]
MPRYFISPEWIVKDTATLQGDDAKHLSTVLRVREGEVVEICDGEGTDYNCVVTAVDKKEVQLKIVEKKESVSEPKTKITLFQGLPKADKMEQIIQKCVELGIEKIVPVSTDRAIVKIDKKDGDKKVQRWQKIAESAAKQSGRGIIPEICSVISFKEAISLTENFDGTIVPYEKETTNGIKEFIKDFNGTTVGVFIGPEGGFSEEEIEIAKENGVFPITLGKRILRTETAGMATVAILLYELG